MKEKNIYKAAFSQIDITPEFQTSLMGCYRPDNRSQGILHRLYAQASLFQNDNETFCLIAIDSLGLTVQRAKILRLKIAELLNIDISHVMLNFSHTHSAPEPTQYALNGDRYFAFLCEQIVSCAESANQNFSPCKIAWALTEANTGENRRPGCSVTDNRLGALLVSDADNEKPIVIIMRVATHNNVLMWQNYKISSDFIGVARERLQQFYGCPIMVLQGAAGNLSPVGVDIMRGGNLDDLHRIAGIFENAAKMLKFELRNIENIQMFSKEITFISDVPSKSEAEKIAAAADETQAAAAAEWLKSCEELRNSGYMTQSFLAEINFFELNEGCFCGVAEEIFCELAIDAKERTNNPLLFLNGYTNGCTGYLATREEWHKGGYELFDSNFVYHKYHGHVMPYRDDTAEQIVDMVVGEWERIVNNI
ncbi:MAG: alkaline ceramidase [Oscillospiraceae bacterium]|nr:alkaline ceramidase [Oscillospiraceae bacterium]